MSKHRDVYDEFAEVTGKSISDATGYLQRLWRKEAAQEEEVANADEWEKRLQRTQRGTAEVIAAAVKTGLKICPLHRASMHWEYSPCIEGACAIWDEGDKCCSLFRGIK